MTLVRSGNLNNIIKKYIMYASISSILFILSISHFFRSDKNPEIVSVFSSMIMFLIILLCIKYIVKKFP